MFDSLKEKLGSFRDDVEETAEEKAEPVDEDEELEEPEETHEFDELEPVDDDDDDDEEAEAEFPETDPEVVDESAGDDAPSEADADRATELESGADAGLEGEVEEPESTPGPGDSGPTPAADPESALSGSERSGEPPADPDLSEGIDGGAETAVHGVEESTEVDEGGESVDEDGDEAGGADEPDDVDDVDDANEADEEDEGGSVGFGRKARSLVRGKFVIEDEDIEEPLEDLELALLSSDVEMGVTEEILENIREELVGETRRFRESTGEVVEDALREAIRDVISVGQFDFEQRVAEAEKPLVIVFTGVNGVGKTTTIAKLSRYLEERGFSSVLANGDTYRAGANEQIREHAEALDRRLIAHDQGGDPAAVLYDAVEYAEAHGVDVVLGDTAGRLHTDEGLMDQLEKIDRVVGPDMTLFVDEAVAGQDAVNRAREFDAAAPFEGAVLTKADADSNGGAAISIAHVTGKPVLFLGTGQGYDDIERFEPDRMIDRLLDEE